jgi:hypothetical protein
MTHKNRETFAAFLDAIVRSKSVAEAARTMSFSPALHSQWLKQSEVAYARSDHGSVYFINWRSFGYRFFHEHLDSAVELRHEVRAGLIGTDQALGIVKPEPEPISSTRASDALSSIGLGHLGDADDDPIEIEIEPAATAPSPPPPPPPAPASPTAALDAMEARALRLPPCSLRDDMLRQVRLQRQRASIPGRPPAPRVTVYAPEAEDRPRLLPQAPTRPLPSVPQPSQPYRSAEDLAEGNGPGRVKAGGARIVGDSPAKLLDRGRTKIGWDGYPERGDSDRPMPSYPGRT